MNILGINAYHGDSAACIVVDGKLVAAVEEERFRRVKHWAGFPARAIAYCLDASGLTLGDVHHVAINTDPKAHLFKKAQYTLRHRPDFRFLVDRFKNKQQRASVEENLSREFGRQSLKAEVHYIEHHLAHLASAHLVSPFDESAAISVDGFGDFSSGAWGVGSGDQLKVEHRIFFPHSLGIFYQALTQYLGFPSYGDEYKVMGLAAYGKPTFIAQMRQIVRTNDDGTYALDLTYFRHHKEKIAYEWHGGAPVIGELFQHTALQDLLGMPSRKREEPSENHHRDLACSVQCRYEEAFFSLLETVYRDYRIENLTLAGGCAMNSVANGKVYRHTPFKRLYVQAAAGDAGGALGAAFAVASQLGETQERFHMEHAYWGAVLRR